MCRRVVRFKLTVAAHMSYEDDAAFRPEWHVPCAVVQCYDTNSLKVVSTYQQKFSRSSFFSHDLPSPTPSEDSGGDAGGEFGALLFLNI